MGRAALACDCSDLWMVLWPNEINECKYIQYKDDTVNRDIFASVLFSRFS
jgi:hypothetical protein